MTMVYVRFGKIENPKFTRVYEGVVNGNEIQLLMPKTSHGGARDILADLGFGDIDMFRVSGEPVEIDERDRIYLKKTKVIQKLQYDSPTEKILIPENPVTPMGKFAKNHSDKEDVKAMKRHYEAGKDRAYHEFGGWKLFLGLFFAGWPTFLTPKSVR